MRNRARILSVVNIIGIKLWMRLSGCIEKVVLAENDGRLVSKIYILLNGDKNESVNCK